ncbi:CLCN5 [Symbiodinium natans]|uniref:Chloride channel protein n=1 Tax=Symbiodinium natans TaxID=878477 RepID=A0A812TH53_9DINO|nr:CLCN5 [Symbiodinium natans]
MAAAEIGAGDAEGDKSPASPAACVCKGRKGWTRLREQALRTKLAELETPSEAEAKSAAEPTNKILWPAFETVNWCSERIHDVDHLADRRNAYMPLLSSWILPALIGVLTASTGTFIEKASEMLHVFRYSYPSVSPEGEGFAVSWHPWSAPPDAAGPWQANSRGFLAYAAVGVLLATISAFLVKVFAPTARGSGIPEVKTILGGFVMKDVLSLRTLIVKVLGLMLSVSSGLALGKEGPTVHIACCWANVCSQWFDRYSANEGRRRELLSVASAAGVSVAFGAPVGGVLFSYEEVSTMFPRSTMIRAFFAAVVAALTLAWYDPLGTGKLTLFDVQYNQRPSWAEYPLFLLMGCVGGWVGALFVHLNMKVSAARAEGTPFRQMVPVTVEVALLALLTAITSFPLDYTRTLSSLAIHTIFHSCTHPLDNVDPMTLCNGEEDSLDPSLVATLLVAATIKFVQVTLTFGTGVPCGLFVPALYVGACLGRALGIVAAWANGFLGFAPAIHPGFYAMVGAASVLGGVCRVTISLVVIMFELTGGLYLIVPFMIAVLAAKWIGDQYNNSIYDCVISLRGYPYLHEPNDVTYSARACDIMQENLHCLPVQPGSASLVLRDAAQATFAGFPVVRSEEDMSFVGYVPAHKLRKFVEEQLNSGACLEDTPVSFLPGANAGVLDASTLVDTSSLIVVPDTPAAQVHAIFRQLGVKVIFVKRQGKLAGIITKKSFLHFLEHGHDSVHQPSSRSSLTVNSPSMVANSYLACYEAIDPTSRGSRNSNPLLATPKLSSPKGFHIPRQRSSFFYSGIQSRGNSLETMRTGAVNNLRASRVLAVTAVRSGDPAPRPRGKSEVSPLSSISWPAEIQKRVRMSRWDRGLVLVLIGALTGLTSCLLVHDPRWIHKSIYGEAESEWRLFSVSVLAALGAATVASRSGCTGSGLPEVKTILGGFVMDDVLSFGTLLSRLMGLALAQASQLFLDAQGAVVHVAACWADLASRCGSKSMGNEANRRELISAACAAGVSVAFGAPLGGVLWSYEQMSSKFTQQTLIMAFLASIFAKLVVEAHVSGIQPVFHAMKLEGAAATHLPGTLSFVAFALLGVMGGLLGAAFVCGNLWVSRQRTQRGWHIGWKSTALVAAVASVNFFVARHSLLLEINEGMALQALFTNCQDASDLLAFCQDGAVVWSADLARSLFISGLLSWFAMTITYDTGIPGGYFFPALLVGACCGRGSGLLAEWVNSYCELGATIRPGLFAMVGAAATLAGVCRVHISLVVVMFELTGALQLVVPFMVAIMIANWTGGAFTCSIDDCHIRLRGYPHLHGSDLVFKSRACDIMDEELMCLTCEPARVSQLLDLVRETTYGGFPLIRSSETRTLFGYVPTEVLRRHLEGLPSRVLAQNPLASFDRESAKGSGGRVLDFSPLVDPTVIQIVPQTRLEQVHQIFLELGLKLVLVCSFGELVGMITKKTFVNYLEDGDIGFMKKDPIVEGTKEVPASKDLETSLLHS